MVVELAQGNVSGRYAGRQLGVDHKTFLRWARDETASEDDWE